jgi:transmembrane sensor
MGQEDQTSRLTAAARWYAELQAEDVAPQTWDAFRLWERDPRNAAAFRQVEGSLAVLDRTSLAAAVSGRRDRRPSGRWVGMLAAAGVLVVAGAAVLVQGRGPAEPLVYITAIGEQRRVALEDGSSATLNTATRIEVAYTGGERLVRLTGGQALFEVERGEVPFVVEAAGTRVEALGTEFEVFLTSEGQQVTLLEGVVAVRASPRGGAPETRMAPGERLLVAGGVAGPASPVDIGAALSWRSGVLQFRDAPLADAVAELNRYAEVQIELGDLGLGAERLSGAFRAGDQDQFVSALTSFLPVQAEREGNRIRISRSDETAP